MKLSEILEIRKIKYKKEIELPYIGLEHIGQGTMSLIGQGKSTDVSSDKYVFKKGDILFGKLRPYFKKVVKVDFDGICSTDIWVIRAKEGYNQDYLFNFLSTDKFIDLTSQTSTGTRMPRADWNFLENTDWEFPPLSEQKRIANILSSFDNKIEQLKKENNILENIAQSIFKEWFVKYNFPNNDGKPYRDSGGKMIDSELGLIPDGWRVEKLGEMVDFINGYAFKSENLLKEEGPNCYKIFKMGNIKKGGGLNTTGKQDYINKNDCETLTKYILYKGDLLMSMTDMKDNVSLLGNTALMNENNKYIVNQRVGLIRPKNDISIDFPYLYLLTNNDPFLTNLRKGANSGVQVNLSTQGIRDSFISIPKDKQILKGFDSFGKPLFEKIFNNEYNIKSIEKVRTALLNKLIINPQ